MRMKAQRFTVNCPKPEPTANVLPAKETNDKHNQAKKTHHHCPTVDMRGNSTWEIDTELTPEREEQEKARSLEIFQWLPKEND